MNRILTLFFVALLGLSTQLRADEGMWIPMLIDRLNYTDLEKMGLQLTPEEIYSVNQSSLKDAIVGLSNSSKPYGFFCTAEVVSPQGLLFTNHHCGYGRIQEHSSVENDILGEGFWAESYEEEIPNEGLTATFLVRMEDVTDSIIPFLSDTMSAEARSEKINEIRTRLQKNASEDDKYHVIVKSFFAGNEYYLFVYEVYEDVRLVGTPPSSIGKFGGDTDNWMWPRHTGDFSVFRIYTAPDGSPAKYAEENIPLKPKHHLPISLDGVEKDDYTMIWGFPGSTERYMTSYGIDFTLNTWNPTLVDAFGTKLAVWDKYMDADRKVKIQYASKHASLANYWKYMIGQTKGLKQLKVYDDKQALERQFTQWVEADAERSKKYGDALSSIASGYKLMEETARPYLISAVAGSGGAEIIAFAQEFGGLYTHMETDKKSKNKEATAERAEQQKAIIESLKETASDYFKNYHKPADREQLGAMLSFYTAEVPSDLWPEQLLDLNKKYKGDWYAYADDVFKKSIFADQTSVMDFLEDPSMKALDKDPAYTLAMGMQENVGELSAAYGQAQKNIGKGERFFIAGLREMQPNKSFYPDANSTLRFTYGSVQDYEAKDAVHFNHITTLTGVMEKEDPANDEFIVEEKLKELYETKDYGPYGAEGEMIVCFLSTNDITGGNSGSPVINGKGELVGIAFDGNWEAMSGDIAYAEEIQRTINVDIRYVLFIMDKFAGATRLIDELTIHKSVPEPERTEVLEMSEAN